MAQAILSIQSHVAYGYVGNKAATFPLQAMGYDLWPVNTVQFSNHTGYGKWQGQIFSEAHIREVIQGIEELGVAHNCGAILSGYLGSREIGATVQATVERFKKYNNKLLYLCDPVIGNDSCFVKPEVLEFFRHQLTADIITPNQFEAETLAGIKVTKLADLTPLAQYFHQRGVKLVLVTGVTLPELEPDHLYILLSSPEATGLLKTKQYPFKTAPNGSGDLFSALFLGAYLQSAHPVTALRQAGYFMEVVMHHTYQAASRELLVTSTNYTTYDPACLPEYLPIPF